MRSILLLISLLAASVSPFYAVTQELDELSVPLKELKNAPTEVVIDGRSVFLSAYPWRDFMPGPNHGPNGSPMMVVVKVVTADKQPFPSGVRMDRVWVLFGEQVWEASQLRPRKKTSNTDQWIKCSDSPQCEITVREGPKWGPNVFVDVVVRLIDKEGRQHLLQVRKQSVVATS